MTKSKVTITFDGADDLIKKFNKQPTIIQREAGNIILNTANRVEKRAKGYAPFDTGYLKQHINSEKTGTLSADVVSSAEYSVYQEFGTRKMAGKSFMRPAMKQEEVFLFQKLQNLLKEGLR